MRTNSHVIFCDLEIEVLRMGFANKILIVRSLEFCIREQICYVMRDGRVSSGVACGGTRPVTQVLGAHQHTFCTHLKRVFKQKFKPKYV